MKIRRLRRRWLLAGSCVLAVSVLAEGTLRLFRGTLPAQLRQILVADPRLHTVPHRYIGHLNRVGSGTDPYGFANDWPWPDTPAIVTLGDSATFGAGVEKAAAWPAVLARALPEDGVVNLALAAAGPQQYLRVHETFGVKLRPRLVLIGFFPRSDFWDALMFDEWEKSGAGGNYLAWRDFGRPASASMSLRQPKGDLVRSLLWRGELVARTTYLGTLLFHAARNLTPSTPSETRVYEAPDGTRLELRPENLLDNINLTHRRSRTFKRVVATVERIHALARENGGSALVVVLPSKEEVYLPLVRESSPVLAAPLRAAVEELGIPCLDLLEGFRRAAAKGDVLFAASDSPLPNARGHALIAELVASHLLQLERQSGL